MTTITMPQAKDSAPVMAIIAVALAPLILGLAVALASVTSQAPVQSPATMTNDANSDDPTPNSGFLEFSN